MYDCTQNELPSSYRQAHEQHTPGHIHCPACARVLEQMVYTGGLKSSMSFREAADAFFRIRQAPNALGRVRYVSPRTQQDLAFYLKTLAKWFGDLRLDQIHLGHIRTYQHDRATGNGFTRKRGDREEISTAGAAKINREVWVLRRVMTAAGCWTPDMTAAMQELEEPDSDVPKALSLEEQERFLLTAATRPEWRTVWLYSMVALHTTFSSDEMRTIRQGDVNLTYGILGVNRKHGKNKYRRRDIALTDGACIWALGELIQRATELAGRGPEMYLFPRAVAKGHYDGNLPMTVSGLRKPFEAVRDAAGVPWFNINGWRHTAITRLAEDGVPIAVIQRRAGHVSPRMTAHYTHISEGYERQVMMAREGRRSQPVVSIADAPTGHLPQHRVPAYAQPPAYSYGPGVPHVPGMPPQQIARTARKAGNF